MRAPEAAALPVTVIAPRRGWPALDLAEPWRHRHLLYFLVWRDLKVRYRQTALGVLWVALQPLLALAVFTALFGRLLRVPSGPVPYPLFVLAALVPWTFFAAAVGRAAQSLVANARLLTRTAVPRLVIPVASVLAGLVDLGLTLVLLAGLMAALGVAPGPGVLLLPVFLAAAAACALGLGIGLAALNVRYRDVAYVLPFLLQIGLYLTPVVYGAGLVPERLRPWLLLNPMTGVVEGVRLALLGAEGSPALGPAAAAASAALGLLVLAAGVALFRHQERGFADVL